ncbi:hypothetical protein CCH79_00018182, partial [Gambusia affinis]
MNVTTRAAVIGAKHRPNVKNPECGKLMDFSSVYALSAGFLAAAGSLSAKLTLGADYLREMCESGLSGWTQSPGGATRCDWLHVPLRLLCGVLLLSCNTLMWTMFSKALRHGSSSAGVTVTTTASNFISSVSVSQKLIGSKFLFGKPSHSCCVPAVIGRLIFGETHSTLWWMGISLTLCGLLVMHSATPQTSPQEAEKKDKCEWYLYDVLLNDVPLRDGDVVHRPVLTAEACEGAEPGRGGPAPERRPHGLPAGHFAPPPRLPLQTLDSLRTTP